MTHIGKTIILFALTVLVIDSVPADTDVHAIDLMNSTRTASTVVCPCLLDEPFVGVLRKIKANPANWIVRAAPIANFAGLPDKRHRTNLFNNGKMLHSFIQQLSIGRSKTSLHCSWVKWSASGALQNKIGMGHYLYHETVEAESALNACVNQINAIASANGLKQKSNKMQSLATVR